jgi:hypothetical protein
LLCLQERVVQQVSLRAFMKGICMFCHWSCLGFVKGSAVTVTPTLGPLGVLP